MSRMIHTLDGEILNTHYIVWMYVTDYASMDHGRGFWVVAQDINKHEHELYQSLDQDECHKWMVKIAENWRG